MAGCGVQVVTSVNDDESETGERVVHMENLSVADVFEITKMYLKMPKFIIGDESFTRVGSTNGEEDIRVKVQRGWAKSGELTPEERLEALIERVRFYELMLGLGIDLDQRYSGDFEDFSLKEVLDIITPGLEVEYSNYDPQKRISNLCIEEARVEHILQNLDEVVSARFLFSDGRLIVTPRQ